MMTHQHQGSRAALIGAPVAGGSSPDSSKIVLRREGGCWMAQWIGPHAEEVVSLFGSDRLPTAFTDRADAAEVVAALRVLNPGVIVEVA